jgi:hypothetical protein
MSDLLGTAIEAHGGMDRWRRINAIRVAGSVIGAIWFVKSRGDVLKDVEFTVETKRQRLTMVFPGQDKHTVFEGTRVAVLNSKDEVTASSEHAERSFDGHKLDTPWDDIHVAYFSGEALWTYLNTPFLYAQEGFQTKEISSITVAGETWRRLQITFPDSVKSHTRTQISCFGPDGLLRRHDYTVDVLGGAPGLNYAYAYRSVGGIMIPTTRRVVAYQGDFQPVWEPVLVEIEIREVSLL